MIHEFRALIPVTTPAGDGYAWYMIVDEFDTYITVILDSGALVEVRQDQVKVWKDFARGRVVTAEKLKKALRS